MMDLFNLKGLAIAFGLGALLAVPAGYYVHKYDADAEQVVVDKQKQEAQQTLLEQTRLTNAKELQLAEVGQQIEVTHNAAQKVLADNDALHRQLVATRGLRDPGRRTGSGGTVPDAATSGPAGVPAGGTDDGRLSAVADQFLLDLTKRANDAGQYARDCHAWAVTVTKRWNAAQTGVSPASTPAP